MGATEVRWALPPESVTTGARGKSEREICKRLSDLLDGLVCKCVKLHEGEVYAPHLNLSLLGLLATLVPGWAELCRSRAVSIQSCVDPELCDPETDTLVIEVKAGCIQ